MTNTRGRNIYWLAAFFVPFLWVVNVHSGDEIFGKYVGKPRDGGDGVLVLSHGTDNEVNVSLKIRAPTLSGSGCGGELEDIGILKGTIILVEKAADKEINCVATLRIDGDVITVSTKHCAGWYSGVACGFDGNYKKVAR